MHAYRSLHPKVGNVTPHMHVYKSLHPGVENVSIQGHLPLAKSERPSKIIMAPHVNVSITSSQISMTRRNSFMASQCWKINVFVD